MRAGDASSFPWLIVVLASGAGACSSGKGEAPAPAAAPVVVERARVEDVPIEVDAVGTAMAVSKVTVSPRVSGQIERIGFREGGYVDKGAVLFVIDREPYRAAMDQARAVLARDEAQEKNLAADAARYKALAARQLIAPADAEAKVAAAGAAAATLDADRAALHTARLNLEWATVRSPVSGRADQRLVDVGSNVAAGTGVVVVRRIKPIYVAFQLPRASLDDALARRASGRDIPVAVLPTPQHAARIGRLTFVGSAVDSGTGAVPCKATFENEDASLWPGAYARVRVHLGVRRSAVVVPRAAVQTGQEGDTLFVVTSNGTAALRRVRTGPAAGNVIVIESGVRPGETVVVDGQLGLTQGRRVTVSAPSPPQGGRS